jgi:hypothetical protein
MAALAAKKVESLADLLREFNHQNTVTVAYKAFCNRLARPAFAEFMRQMLTRLVEQLSIRILAPEGNAAVARFDDIVIQDGSSFALKKALSEVFSGRFTTVEPAAVEVHATYSGFTDRSERGRDRGRQRGGAPVPPRTCDARRPTAARRSRISEHDVLRRG